MAIQEPPVMIDRRTLRAMYSTDVADALREYIQQGGQFSFTSDRGSPSSLEIHFTLQDADLYQGLLGRRLGTYAAIPESVPQ